MNNLNRSDTKYNGKQKGRMKMFAVCLTLAIIFAVIGAVLLFGSVYLKHKAYDELIAAKDFVGAIELDPDNAETYIKFARHLEESGVRVVDEKGENEEADATVELTAVDDTVKKLKPAEDETVTVGELAKWFSEENLSSLKRQFPGEYVDVNYTVGMLIWNNYEGNGSAVMKAAMPYFGNVVTAINGSPDLLDANTTEIVKTFYKLSYLYANKDSLGEDDSKKITLTPAEVFVEIEEENIANEETVYISIWQSCKDVLDMFGKNKSVTTDLSLRTLEILNGALNENEEKFIKIGKISITEFGEIADILLDAVKRVDTVTDDQEDKKSNIQKSTYDRFIEEKNYAAAIKLDPDNPEAYKKFANYLAYGSAKITYEKKNDGGNWIYGDELDECFSDANLKNIKKNYPNDYVKINYKVGLAVWNNYVEDNVDLLLDFKPYFERVLTFLEESGDNGESTEELLDNDSVKIARNLYKLGRLNQILASKFKPEDLTRLDRFAKITEDDVDGTNKTCDAMKDTCEDVLECFDDKLSDNQKKSIKDKINEIAVPERWEYK